MFLPNRVRIGNQEIAFADLIKQAYMARIQLSAAGFYKTPKIHWNRDKGQGRPFYYFAYGAACSEVSIDTLTGEYVVERTDILHDAGRSLNRAIDLGQVEGGFIQGMGWLTTEELWWDAKGRLRTHAPSTYKIPLASDRPKDLQREARRLAGGERADDPSLQGRRRAAVPARHLGAACAVGRGGERGGSQDLPAARCAGDARARADGGGAAEGQGGQALSWRSNSVRKMLCYGRMTMATTTRKPESLFEATGPGCAG